MVTNNNHKSLLLMLPFEIPPQLLFCTLYPYQEYQQFATLLILMQIFCITKYLSWMRLSRSRGREQKHTTTYTWDSTIELVRRQVYYLFYLVGMQPSLLLSISHHCCLHCRHKTIIWTLTVFLFIFVFASATKFLAQHKSYLSHGSLRPLACHEV